MLDKDVKTRKILKTLKDEKLVDDSTKSKEFQALINRERRKLKKAAVKLTVPSLEALLEEQNIEPKDTSSPYILEYHLARDDEGGEKSLVTFISSRGKFLLGHRANIRPVKSIW